MPALSIEIPQIVLNQYGNLDDAKKSIMEDIIIQERQKGMLTIREAAKELNVSYSEYAHILETRGLPLENSTKEERSENFKRFESEYNELKK